MSFQNESEQPRSHTTFCSLNPGGSRLMRMVAYVLKLQTSPKSKLAQRVTRNIGQFNILTEFAGWLPALFGSLSAIVSLERSPAVVKIALHLGRDAHHA